MAIAGLVSPQSGTIAMGGQILFSKADRIDVRPHERKVGFVFQDLALWPHLSALDHVYLVGHPAGFARVEALSLLESVGLGGFGPRRPSQLSGGEQQRLAIARALAGKPWLLLLDEPFSSLDVKMRSSLYGLLRQVSPLVSGPTIYVTHNVEDARALAEAAVVLEDGTLARSECPWEQDVPEQG
jgi:ABC-type sulfate/molybdate transport systems ATPase subunit